VFVKRVSVSKSGSHPFVRLSNQQYDCGRQNNDDDVRLTTSTSCNNILQTQLMVDTLSLRYVLITRIHIFRIFKLMQKPRCWFRKRVHHQMRTGGSTQRIPASLQFSYISGQLK